MRKVLALVGCATMLLAPLPALAQDAGEGGSRYSDNDYDDLSQPNAKPQEPRPAAVERKKFDETVTRMFVSADTDRNGIITLDELRSVIAARKETVIHDRFAAIDTNHDQSLSYAEFSAWQRGLGSVVLGSDAAANVAIVPEDIRPDLPRGPDGEVMAAVVEPLNAKLIAAANTNYDGGASLAEILAYEDKRFDTLDTNHDGWVTELEAGRRIPRGGPSPGG